MYSIILYRWRFRMTKLGIRMSVMRQIIIYILFPDVLCRKSWLTMRSFYTACYFIKAGVLMSASTAAQVAAVKFIVTVPEFPAEKNKAVHLAGSFNGWKANDSLYLMSREKENTYSLVVPLFEGKKYEYKYTLGDWSTVEINKNDSEITNRKMYSRNETSLFDTVLKWKMPSSSKSPSPQMQKVMAMKDSLKLELQSTLNRLLVVLKQYNATMLSPSPNERQHKKLNKETIGIIAEFYKTIERRVWELGTSLLPEQKKKILAAIKDPGASKGLLTTLGNAYGDAFK